MVVNRKPVWAQSLALAMMLLWASGIGSMYAADRQPPVSAVGLWSTVLAPPIVLILALVRWRRQAVSRFWIMSASAATYSVAGLFARGYTLDATVAHIPLFKLMQLIYPFAGLLWGFLLFRAAERGYVPLANVTPTRPPMPRETEGHRSNRPLRRTALVLSLLFVADIGFAGQGILPLFVAAAGVVLLSAGAIWAFAFGRMRVARRRIARAGIYFLLGVATSATVRVYASTAQAHATQLIHACHAYKAKYGGFPDRLQELVPEFLPSVPRAKYVLVWGEFTYWSSPTSHTLMYTSLPPFMRRLYNLEHDTWSQIE